MIIDRDGTIIHVQAPHLAPDGLGGVDGDVLVFLLLPCIELLAARHGEVERTLVDGVGHRVVDQLAAMQTRGIRREMRFCCAVSSVTHRKIASDSTLADFNIKLDLF